MITPDWIIADWEQAKRIGGDAPLVFIYYLKSQGFSYYIGGNVLKNDPEWEAVWRRVDGKKEKDMSDDNKPYDQITKAENLLQEVITAWNQIPLGSWSSGEIERWLLDWMAPTIRDVKKHLKDE